MEKQTTALNPLNALPIPIFLHKSPSFLKNYFSEYDWHIQTHEKVLYLTFDDGPIAEITDWVLQQLADYQALATFFCIGENVENHPKVYRNIIAQGHSIGNHTYNHLNGWKTETDIYLQNAARCQATLGVETNLFRPPYGRIRNAQAQPLLKNHRIVMWDVLTGDFEKYLSPQRCLAKTLEHTQSGSIIVMHDSHKAWQNMSYVLPRFLEEFSAKGYRFEALPQNIPLEITLSKAVLNVKPKTEKLIT